MKTGTHTGFADLARLDELLGLHSHNGKHGRDTGRVSTQDANLFSHPTTKGEEAPKSTRVYHDMFEFGGSPRDTGETRFEEIVSAIN